MRIVLSTQKRLHSDIYHETNSATIEPLWSGLKEKLTIAQRENYHADHLGIVQMYANHDGNLARRFSKTHLSAVRRDLFGLD